MPGSGGICGRGPDAALLPESHEGALDEPFATESFFPGSGGICGRGSDAALLPKSREGALDEPFATESFFPGSGGIWRTRIRRRVAS